MIPSQWLLARSTGESSEILGSATQDHGPELKGGLITSLQPLRIHSSHSQPPRAPTLQECEVIIRQLYSANSLQSQEVSVRHQTLLVKLRLLSIVVQFKSTEFLIFYYLYKYFCGNISWLYDNSVPFRLYVWRLCWEILFWARKSPQKTTFWPRPTLLMVPGKYYHFCLHQHVVFFEKRAQLW